MKSTKQKVLDMLNWVKSELSQEIHPKLGKSMHPYRKGKIVFLSKIQSKLTDIINPNGLKNKFSVTGLRIDSRHQLPALADGTEHVTVHLWMTGSGNTTTISNGQIEKYLKDNLKDIG